MLAKDNEYLQEAVESLYVANADEIVRQQCRAREDAERLERTLKRDNKLLKEQLAERDATIADKDATIADKDIEIAEKIAEIANKDARIAELEAQLANT